MSKIIAGKIKEAFPVLVMGSLFVIIDSLALLVSAPFEASGFAAFSDPNDPLNIVYLFLTLLITTAAILLIAKFWKKKLIQGIVLASTGLLIVYTVFPLLIYIVSEEWSLLVSVAAAAVLIVALVKYPEWYIVDACCILIGAGAIGMLGISLSISLVIILLVGLAIYDAISVYKTKHMIDLADTLIDLKLPVLFAIPRTRKYSMIKETKRLKEKIGQNGKRDAFFMGLGDIIMPGLLVVSTFYNIADKGLVVALSVMLGTLFGFAILMIAVIGGKPQAGLPYLCSGAILGYLVSSYILFGGLAGLVIPV